MTKAIPESIKIRILELVRQGKTDQEIVGLIGWKYKTAARRVGDIRRTASIFSATSNSSTAPKTLDQMGREERFEFLKKFVSTTPRARIFFASFSEEEKQFFLDEYLNIVKSTDSLNEAEEQALFSAIVELVLASRALKKQKIEEDLYEKTMNGQIQPDDIRFRREISDQFPKEHDSHMKLYQKFLEDLKMSRSQRLKEIRSDKRTLMDVVEELSSKTAQADAANKIEQLAKMRDEELTKLIKNGFLMGYFED